MTIGRKDGMGHALIQALKNTAEDSFVLIFFLFLTYLAMEFLEHRTGDKTGRLIQKAGRWGPFIGSLLGVAPQCGFSAAASNLYAGRVITMGTLIAIYLSTSDEMLPVMISARAPLGTIGRVLAAKVLVGMLAGFAIDLIHIRRNRESAAPAVPFSDKGETRHIHEMCRHERCECEKGILRSALKHTVQVGAFILIVSFALNVGLEISGENVLAGFLLNRPVLGPVLAGLVGFVPNCAASVVITELYLEGIISAGAMLSGLLVGSGVGLLVLFRVNHHLRENLKIVGLLYIVGVLAGIVTEFAVG